MKAGDLPPQPRGDIEADATVLVSVQRLTENGFSESFEVHVLAAEQGGVVEAMDGKAAVALLRKIADENKPHYAIPC